MHNALTPAERQESISDITLRFGSQVPSNIRSQCDLLLKEGSYERQLQIIRALHDLLENKESNLAQAKDIIEKGGGKFYGPESLLPMGLKVPSILPPLPPMEEIERYAAQRFSLRLMPDTAADNTPLTMEKMNEVLEPLIKKCQNKMNPKEDDWKLLWGVDWYPNEDFYKKATTPLCWVFTSDSLLDGSRGVNYLKQTDSIAAYAEKVLYKGKLTREVDDALVQFKNERASIDAIIGTTRWKEAAEALRILDITKLFRPEAHDVIFFFVQTFLNSPPNKRERLLETLYTWTKTKSSDGDLVYVGRCDSKGADVRRRNPDSTNGRLGALVVRKFRGLKS